MRKELDLLISSFDKNMEDQLISLFNETISEIALSNRCRITNLTEFDRFITRHPQKYCWSILQLIKKLKLLSATPNHMNFNQFFERDIRGFFEQSSIESVTEIKELITTRPEEIVLDTALQVEQIDESNKKKSVLDQLFDTLTTHPLKTHLINKLSPSKSKKKTVQKNNKTKLLLDDKTHSKGKIAISLDPMPLFKTLYEMIGIKPKPQKTQEAPAVHFLDLDESIEFLKEWIIKCNASQTDHPHLILFAIYIFNQITLTNKKKEQTNELLDDIIRILEKQKPSHNFILKNFKDRFKPITSPPLPPSPQEVDSVRRILLRADARDTKSIELIKKIKLDEFSKRAIISKIIELTEKNTIESLGKALLIYDLHSHWLNSEKTSKLYTNIAEKAYLLILTSKSHIDITKKLLNICGYENKTLQQSLVDLLNVARSSDHYKEKANTLYLVILFIKSRRKKHKLYSTGQDIPSIERLNLIKEWLGTASTIDLHIDSSNFIDISNFNAISAKYLTDHPFILLNLMTQNEFNELNQKVMETEKKLEAFSRLNLELCLELTNTKK